MKVNIFSLNAHTCQEDNVKTTLNPGATHANISVNLTDITKRKNFLLLLPPPYLQANPFLHWYAVLNPKGWLVYSFLVGSFLWILAANKC